MENIVKKETLTKGVLRKMVNDMQAPKSDKCLNREFCANCQKLVNCANMQVEILKNRKNCKPDSRQLPLFNCVSSNFKHFQQVDKPRNIF